MFEGDGRVQEYVGGYEDWVRQRLAEKSAALAASKNAAAGGETKPQTTNIVATPTKL